MSAPLDHVMMRVEDLEASLDWYQSHFDYEEKGLDALAGRVWTELGLMRIYMDKPGRGVDYEEPLVLEEGSTIEDACHELGGEFKERFRFARVSGPSAKHDEQQVGLDHELADEDVLRITTRK